MNVTDWKFDWFHLNESISIYYKFRQDDALDGIGRPHCETLAYMQKLAPLPGYSRPEYRALLHSSDNVVEMGVSRTTYPMEIMAYIQNYFSYTQ